MNQFPTNICQGFSTWARCHHRAAWWDVQGVPTGYHGWRLRSTSGGIESLCCTGFYFSADIRSLTALLCVASTLLLPHWGHPLSDEDLGAWGFLLIFPDKFMEDHSCPRLAFLLRKRAYQSQDSVLTSCSLNGLHNGGGQMLYKVSC